MNVRKTRYKTRTRVVTIVCPKCEIELYSRSRHDFRGCKCGTFVDGGFEYLRYGWPNGYKKPEPKVRYIPVSREELYNDWDRKFDKLGVITKRAKNAR